MVGVVGSSQKRGFMLLHMFNGIAFPVVLLHPDAVQSVRDFAVYYLVRKGMGCILRQCVHALNLLLLHLSFDQLFQVLSGQSCQGDIVVRGWPSPSSAYGTLAVLVSSLARGMRARGLLSWG